MACVISVGWCIALHPAIWKILQRSLRSWVPVAAVSRWESGTALMSWWGFFLTCLILNRKAFRIKRLQIVWKLEVQVLAEPAATDPKAAVAWWRENSASGSRCSPRHQRGWAELSASFPLPRGELFMPCVHQVYATAGTALSLHDYLGEQLTDLSQEFKAFDNETESICSSQGLMPDFARVPRVTRVIIRADIYWALTVYSKC